jgi:hypothetical protein
MKLIISNSYPNLFCQQEKKLNVAGRKGPGRQETDVEDSLKRALINERDAGKTWTEEVLFLWKERFFLKGSGFIHPQRFSALRHTGEKSSFGDSFGFQME